MATNDWQQAVAEHEAAIEACIAASRRVPDSQWNLAACGGQVVALTARRACRIVLPDGHRRAERQSSEGASRTRCGSSSSGPSCCRRSCARTSSARGVPAPREMRPHREPQERAARRGAPARARGEVYRGAAGVEPPGCARPASLLRPAAAARHAEAGHLPRPSPHGSSWRR